MSVAIAVLIVVVVVSRARRGAVVSHHRPHRGRARPEALFLQEAAERQPDRAAGRGRLPGRAVDPGPAVQAVAGVRGEEVPVGTGARGRDRRRDRAGREPAADRRQERRLQARLRELLVTREVHFGRRPKGCATPGVDARHVGAHPPGRVPGRHLAQGLRTSGFTRRVGAGEGDRRRAATRVVRPHARTAAGRGHRAARPTGHDRHRHDARRSAAAVGGHREPPGRLRRHRGHGARISGTAGLRGHRSADGFEERSAQQLPGLPAVPRRRWSYRAATRSAPVRRVSVEPVPDARRDGPDADRQPRRGRRHQGVRRVADAGHVGGGVQVRLDRASRPPRNMERATAHREVPDQPARVRRRDRPHVDPDVELGRGGVDRAQPRRASVADRGQEPGRICVQDRPPGADPRARHARRRSSRWSARCRTS